MKLEPIIDYLVTKGHGIKGKNLFARSMPAQVEHGVLVITNAPILVHPYQTGRQDGTMQIIVRGTSYDAIYDLASDISKSLTVQGLDLGQYKLIKCQPKHTPLIYPRAKSSLLEASVNFDITYIDQ